MKFGRQPFLAGMILWLAAFSAAGDTNLNSTAQAERTGEIVVPERLTATDLSTASNLRPPRQERQKLPPEVLARIEDFRREARAYLDQEEALRKSLLGANATERAAIRDQMNALRDQWLARALEERREFKDRIPELRDRLSGHAELLEELRRNATEQAREAQENTRERRALD